MKVTKDYTFHGVVLEDLLGQKRTNFIQFSPVVRQNKYCLLESATYVENGLNYINFFLETISQVMAKNL